MKNNNSPRVTPAPGQFDSTARSNPLTKLDVRLTELASLSRGWDGGSAEPISPAAIEAVREILGEVDHSKNRPGVFPAHSGGVVIEWDSASTVRSVEVSKEGTFEMFELKAGSPRSFRVETTDLNEVVNFLRSDRDTSLANPTHNPPPLEGEVN